jgi:general secretion pathway protein J
VTSIRSAYLLDGTWRDSWRGDPTGDIPVAVRLDMQLEDLGDIDQLFLTSGEGR